MAHDSRESEDNFGDSYDPMEDVVRGNQESIIRMYREAIKRIDSAMRRGNPDLVPEICKAINTYHPMHEESWVGFPEGSEPK